jgi:hypothetical protein
MNADVVIEVFLWLCVLVAIAALGIYVHESIATHKHLKRMRERELGKPVEVEKPTDKLLFLPSDESEALLALQECARETDGKLVTIDMVAGYMGCSRSWAGKLLLRLHNGGHAERISNGRRVFYTPV